MVLYTGALAGKQLKAISLTTVIGAAVNVVLNFILIPMYGVWGATIATAIGFGVPVVWLYFLLRNRYPVPYPIKRLLAALALEGGLLLIGLALPPLPLLGRMAVKLAILGVLPMGYILLGIVTPSEIRHGGLAVRSLWRRFRAG
jgi:O-antigen/teichoic acid export membrane protein